MAEAAPVWVLLGQRTGDNNQLLSLARELGLPFRTLELRYNQLHLVPPALLGSTFASLARESRELMAPPWPQLALGIGHRSVPVALRIRDLSGGKSKIVRLGNPRLDPSKFDLVITTSQYDVPRSSNVLSLPIGISTVPKVEPTREEREWLDKLARPHRLLLLGGETFMWKLGTDEVVPAVSKLKEKPGSIIAVASGRSSERMIDAVAAELTGSGHGVIRGRFPSYPVLIDDADEIYVTADSVAMISDAIATGKPVGLIEPRKDVWGNVFYGIQKLGVRVPVRDIQRFWTAVRSRGLAGTIDEPIAGKLDLNPLGVTAAAVRKLLD